MEEISYDPTQIDEPPYKDLSESGHRSSIMRVFVVPTALMGLCYFFLYEKPTKDCIVNPDCGQPIADMIGAKLADTILYICGAGMCALMNAAFAVKLIERLSQLVKENKSPYEKASIIAAGILVGLAGTGSTGLNAYSNRSPTLEIILAMVGAAVSRVTKAFQLWEKYQHFSEGVITNTKRAWWWALEKTVGLSKEQKAAQEAVKKKLERHKELQRQVTERWNEILKKVSNKEEIFFPHNFTLVDVLDKEENPEYYDRRSTLEKFIPVFLKIFPKGFIFLFVICPILLTMLESLKKLYFNETSPQAILAAIAVGFMEYLVVYNIAGEIGQSLADGFNSMWHHKPYPNLTYQLNKKTVMAVEVTLLAASCFSFANVLQCYLLNATPYFPYNHFGLTGRLLTIFSTAAYHSYPAMNLFGDGMRWKNQDLKHQQLYEMQDFVKKISRFSPNEAHQFICSEIPPNIQVRWRIQVEETTVQNSNSTNCLTLWCCWFKKAENKLSSDKVQDIENKNEINEALKK